jgi:sulfoxide reductase heme-binding subunit YedZ
MASLLARRALWWLLFLACLLPLASLVHDGLQGTLGPNPVETVLHHTGDWALRLLLATLALRPLQRLTGKPGWLRWRRMLGLYSFFYALLHALAWAWLDRQWMVDEMLADVLKRPYITLGFSAVLLLIPLAATSTRAAMRSLGRNWQRLHRLVYPAAALGVLHFLWLVKADWTEPAIYAVVLVTVLLLRWPPVGRYVWRGHGKRMRVPTPTQRHSTARGLKL